jgi:hypothetical protein
MSMHRLVTGHVSAFLSLPMGVDTTAARSADRALPGGWTLTAASAAAAAGVEVTTGPAAVIGGRNKVRLQLPAAVAASGTLAYATYTALEPIRQRQRKVTVHATALTSPDGEALLLLGSKAAGKTSTALALAIRGWTHAGDDLVVLGETSDGGLAVWPGKPTAAIRDPSRPLAPKLQQVLAPFAAGPAPLARVVRLAIHPALVVPSLTSGAPLSVNERLRLHEMLGRYISGLPTPVGGVFGMPYGPVWPLDTPELARWRSHFITRLEGCRFGYLHAPGAEEAADLLAAEDEFR